MFSTRLLALIVAATAASSVQGKTVSLVSRQLAPAIPGIPVPCQPVCVVFTALQQSITPQQLCTPANAANIQRCAQCIMTMNTSSVIGNGDLMTQLQTAVNSFTNACAAAQVPVPPITLVNPLTQQPLLGTGTLPTPGLPLPGAPGAAPLPPGAAVPQPGVPGAGGLSPSETAPFMPQEIRKDVTIKGTHNIPMAPIGQTPGAALPVPGAPVPGVPAPVPGAPVVPGLPIPGQQGQVVQPGTQLLQQPGQVPPVPPVAAAPPVGVPGIQSQRPTRVRRSLPNNPISLLRRLESSSSSSSTTSSATASSPSSPKSNGAGAGMDTRKIVGLTVIGLFVSWVL